MVRNYLITALRSFFRKKVFFFLNILGLTSGFVVFILISIYVTYEFSFDKYHHHNKRIYRVVKQDVDNFYQGNNTFGVTPAPLAGGLMEEFPEVESATRIIRIRK